MKRLIFVLTLFGIFTAISDIQAATSCKYNELGIKVCGPKVADQQICMVVSVWESDFFHPKNRSYTTLLKCKGACKPNDKKYGIKRTFADCKTSIVNENENNVSCIKVGCGANTFK